MYTLMKPFRKPTHLIGQEIPKDSEIIKMGRGEETSMRKSRFISIKVTFIICIRLGFMVPEIDTSDWPTQTFIDEVNPFFVSAVNR